jgi:hypothetical protein
VANRKSFGKQLRRTAKREARLIGKGVVKEGGKIAVGVIKGLLSILSPFR